jgi:carboxyl-terminal processing protease
MRHCRRQNSLPVFRVAQEEAKEFFHKVWKGIMTKRFSLLTVAVLVLVGMIAGSVLNRVISGDNIYEQLTKFKDVLSLTEKYYVEDVDTQKLTESAINGVLNDLDPHSVYIPASQLQRVNEEFQGSFDGIGIEFSILNDTLLVVSPIIGGPSEALGIMAGDKIVRINDSSAVKITEADVRSKLRGPKGTHVRVTILRAGIDGPLDFDITRDKIPLYTVDTSFMIDDQTGYVTVTRFAATTYTEFVEALTHLKKSGMKRLVLDLRGNAGGFLEQAFKLTDELMPKGKKIVYTKGRRTEFDEEYVSSGGAKFADIGLIVLVNNGSASASEIVSGAVQDWDRGLIVGETTFGKGLVQRQFPLGDGSAFRLTTARYYTPSGRLIQRPYGEDKAKYQREAFERDETEGENVEHMAEKDSTRPVYKTAGGRPVYGGGGITPDYIVKSDRLSEYTVQLRSKLVFLAYSNAYVEEHGKELRDRYGKDVMRFAAEFQMTPEMLDGLLAIAKSKNIEFKKDQYEKDLRYVKALTKAFIGRNLWGNEGSARVMLAEDTQFIKAMTLFPEAEKIARNITSLK